MCNLSVVSTNEGSEGRHVKGSPFLFTIRYGALEAPNCRVEGVGVHGTTINGVDNAVLAGEPQEFKMFTFDTYRNQIMAGGDFVEAVLVFQPTGKKFKCRVEDNEDGSYTVRYHTMLLGAYELHLQACSAAHGNSFGEVRRHMKTVAGSPWRIQSLDGHPCPAQTTASGPGVS
eukprot:scaffold528390_cov55-Prasinocladus_malaysianus.AAC.1